MKKIYRIGKHPSNDIQIEGSYIEDFHAKIYWKHQQWYIEDLNSRFGTFIGQKRISEPTIINQNSYIKLGTALLHWTDYVFEDRIDKSLYLQDFYDPTRRVDRTNFRYLCILIALAPILAIFAGPILLEVFVARKRRYSREYIDLTPYYPYVQVFAGVILGYIILVLCINRMRDTGKPLGYLLIPFYNIYLLWSKPSLQKNNIS